MNEVRRMIVNIVMGGYGINSDSSGDNLQRLVCKYLFFFFFFEQLWLANG